MKSKFNPFHRISLPLALLALAFSQSVQADTTTTQWIGGDAGAPDNWGTITNWAGSVLPSSSVSALFDSTFANQPTPRADKTAQGVWLATGVGQDVTINSDLPSAPVLTITGTATLNSQTNAGIYMNDSGNHNLNFGSNLNILLSNATGFYNQQSAGTLTVSGGLNLNGKALTIGAGATSTGNVTISGNITPSSGGSITINTAGTVTLSGSTNAFTGGTTVTAGTLVVGSNSAVGTGKLTLNDTNTLQASTDVVLTNSTVVLNKGTTTFSGANSITMGVNTSAAFIGGGDKTITNNLPSGKTLTFTGNIAQNGNSTARRLIIGGSGDTTFSAILSDGNAVGSAYTVSSTGITTMSGNNTLTGNQIVNAGATLKMGHANALGFGGLTQTTIGTTTVNSGGVLDLNGMTGVSEPIALNGTGIGSGGALINNSGSPASIGNGIAALTVSSGGTGLSAAPTITFSGTGSGAAATASLGLTLASITSISGGTGWVTGDTVKFTGGAAFYEAVGVVTASGGAITGISSLTSSGWGYTAAPTAITKVTGSGSVTGVTLTANANNFTVGSIKMTAAGSGYTGTPTATWSGGGSATPTLSSVNLGLNSSIGGTGDITIDAVVTESGGSRTLTKVGAGTLTFTGSNTYTGATNVNVGTLNLSNQNAVQSSTLTMNGGSLVFDQSVGGNAFTFGGLAGTSSGAGYDIALQNNAGSPVAIALTVGGNNANTTYAGVLSAGGSLTKSGTGALTLTGSSSYSGGTTIKNGRIIIGGGNDRLLTTGTVTLGDTSTSGKLVVGDGTNRNQTLAGLTTTGSGGSVVGGAGFISGLTLNIAGSNSFDGTLGGANTNENNLALTKTGVGTLTLSGSNTHSGGTTVTDGTLVVGSNSAVGTGKLTLSAGSTLQASTNVVLTNSTVVLGNLTTTFSGSNSITMGVNTSAAFIGGGDKTITNNLDSGKTLTFSGNLQLNGNATPRKLTIAGTGNTTFSGNLSDNASGPIAVTSTGTTTFSGTNTYTGATTVNAGTLALVGGSQASAITVNNSGTSLGFTLGSTTSSTSTVSFGAGTTVKITGTPTLASYTLMTASSFTGIAPVLATAIPGYDLVVEGGNTLKLNQVAGGYNSWKGANAGGQTPDLDWDSDGVANGVEYFMNAAAGFTANPSLTAGNTITWTNGGNIPNSAYGTQYVVQTSGDLVIWTDVPVGGLTTNTSGPGGSLTYTLTGSGKRFVRLKVTPTP